MVERFVRDEEAAGSNPVTSTIIYGIHKSECRFFCLHSRIMQDSNLLFIAKRDEVCAAGADFESCHLDQLVASFVSLATIFL